MTELESKIIEALDDKKGENILLLDLREIDGSISDSFIICSGASTTQVCALADNVEDHVQKELGEKVWRVEGTDNGIWVVMDYGDVMVHIFENETRAFYALEKLWGDAKISSHGTNN